MDAFVHEDDLIVEDGTPDWKANFLRKNAAFYTQHQDVLEAWLERWDYLRDFPASRRKFEWQAQDAASLDETIMHLRRPGSAPSEPPTSRPSSRSPRPASWATAPRLSPREVARLQGLPEWFDFGDQPDAATYKQMGNGVNVGAAYHVFREHVLANLAPSASVRRTWLRRSRRRREPRHQRSRRFDRAARARSSTRRVDARRPSTAGRGLAWGCGGAAG